MKKLLLCFAVAAFGASANSYAQTYLTQDFEGASVPTLPTGWADTHTGMGNGWETYSGACTLNTGIQIPAHTKIAVVRDGIAHNNYPAKLSTGTFSLAGSSGVFLVFDYWFPQYHLTALPNRRETAWIEFSTNGGSSYTTIDSFGAYNGWKTKAISITGTSANCILRFCYSDNRINATDTAGIAGIGLDNIRVLTPPASSIQLTNVVPNPGFPGNDFGVVGSGNITIGGTVYNWGGSTVNGFSTSYKVGSGSWVSGSVTGLSIAPFSSGTFACTTPYVPAALGSQNINIAVNLTGDATLSDDSLSTSANGVSSFPTKRTFFEEPTGTWCGWCVRGVVYMDSIWRAHKGMVSVVSVHNRNGYDEMANDNSSSTNYDNWAAGKVGGFPSLLADRYYVADPSDVFAYYNGMANWYGFANLAMTTSISGTSINAVAKVTPTMNLSGDYRVELIITEDRVHGTTGGFAQHNYYSGGGSGAMQNTEYNFATLGSTIPASTMYYDFVARYTVPDMSSSPNGVASSLPSSMTSGTTYSYNFTPVTIASNWTSNKLRAVLVLIDNNSANETFGSVLNSVESIWSVGVENVAAGIKGGRIFPNPATQEANLIFDTENDANVTISVYDAVGRLMFSKTQHMNAGEQHETLQVAEYAAGVYNVVIATGTGSVSERFTVTK